MMNNYWIGIMTQTGIYLLAVLGVCILTGFTGLFSFGHAGFMAVGGYVSGIAVKIWGLSLPMGLLLGMSAATLLGVIIGTPTLKLRGDYFLIATLGIGEAIRMILENWEFVGGAKGMTDVGCGVTFPMVLVLDVFAVVLLVHFLHSKHGRSCVAIRENEMAALAMGINVARYKVLAMGISCALAGLAGALLGHYMNYLQPTMFNSVKSNELLIMVIMGGFGSLTGSIISTLILVPLPEFLRVGSNIQEWRMVIYGLLVVLIILFKPTGLMGYREFSFNNFIRFIKGLPQRFRLLTGKSGKKEGTS